MAQRITVQVWRGEKQIFGRPDRPSAAAVTMMRKLGFTQHTETGRWQIKCGAARIEETIERLSQLPGFEVVDAEPGDPISWRDRSVTGRQREFAAELGVAIPDAANRGDASQLIDAALDARSSANA